MCGTVHVQREALGNACTLLSPGSTVDGGATRRARLGPSPRNRGGREHREGSGPSSPTQIVTGNGSPIPTIPSPLGLDSAPPVQCNGRPQARLLRDKRHVVNLFGAFASATRVDDWLTEVADLGAT
jgi:hypothetical protein